MSGSMGCGGLGVSGLGGDSVIRVTENISQDVSFPTPQALTESISESVTVVIT